MIGYSTVEQFNKLDMQAIEGIKDAKLRKKALALKAKQGGFTLLELLVVVAILAVLAGGLMVAYDGLTEKAGSADSSLSLAAIDQGIRSFKAINKQYPNELDDLAVDATTGIKLLGAEAQEKLGAFTLTTDMATSLVNAGVTKVRQISAGANGAISNTTTAPAAASNPEAPNAVFNVPALGGIATATEPLTGPTNLAAGTVVSIVANAASSTVGCGTNVPFDGIATNKPIDATRLSEMANFKLDHTKCHVVVALGIGNNSNIISEKVGFASAPVYGKVGSREYARYLALFHVASDTDGDGAFTTAGEINDTAKFVGVIDTNGDPLAEELAESK